MWKPLSGSPAQTGSRTPWSLLASQTSPGLECRVHGVRDPVSTISDATKEDIQCWCLAHKQVHTCARVHNTHKEVTNKKENYENSPKEKHASISCLGFLEIFVLFYLSQTLTVAQTGRELPVLA